MALIEGVGDEVTLLFGSLLLLMVLLLAWISTQTSDPPEHLFTSATDPAPSLRTGPIHQDTPPTASTSSSSPSSSVSDSSLTDAPTAPPQEEKDEERGDGRGERLEGGGDGVRNRGGGEESPPSQRNMVVRLKFLNDTERTAQVQPQDTIGYIKRTYFAGQEQQVRLIYQGQLLQDDAQTLASLTLVHNCVLHCHISQHAGRGGGGRGQLIVAVALNVGSLMVPLLALMLSVLWYCQIQYRQFFTAPATASLVGVTIFLSLVAFGVYRR
ncbi:LOW QUALITY PROTEIN: transmembrane and ubiquitin-like domain-containing protein 1 [Hippoglossus stenolepis]|uniref:LOW QUALITY PROTEIN: transmembrane and ubiquitin-like domain-containing protein 1 n=1 Tax=Hippoglossus stenolepis TaxID=195615 RepID=UPI001FAE84BF|nr:LOW QUALITY PROTEIN: transmembrane and ubiquitin-like domain-containing protein 1 [Hippoglossus stenolepis]